MSKSIKANKFTKANIVKGASVKKKLGVRRGLPCNDASKGTSVIDGYTMLADKEYVGSDSVTNYDDMTLTLLGLNALNITVELIEKDAPAKSFSNSGKEKPFNDADKKNNMQDKNYGDDTFPEKDNPIYEMDEGLPNYMKNSKKSSKSTKGNSSVMVEVFSQIVEFNTIIMKENNFKLTQFAESN